MDISFNKMAEFSGQTRRTVKRKVLASNLKPAGKGTGGNWVWNSKEALPLLYKIEKPDKPDRSLDFSEENTRLISERADAQALKNAKLRKRLIPASEVDKTWERIVSAITTELLKLPGRFSERFKTTSTASDRRAFMEAEVKKSLTFLADQGASNRV